MSNLRTEGGDRRKPTYCAVRAIHFTQHMGLEFCIEAAAHLRQASHAAGPPHQKGFRYLYGNEYSVGCKTGTAQTHARDLGVSRRKGHLKRARTFRGVSPYETTRAPAEILAHIGDLLDWALRTVQGEQIYKRSPPLPWEEESARFFAALKALDSYLASNNPLGCPPEKLFQGPVADALTHVGQLTLLRRMAGAPVRGENYFAAEIEAGRVSADQSTKRMEFD